MSQQHNPSLPYVGESLSYCMARSHLQIRALVVLLRFCMVRPQHHVGLFVAAVSVVVGLWYTLGGTCALRLALVG